MLFRALGFLLLFDGGDDSPGGTAGANDVLVSNGKQVTLIDGKFASDLTRKVNQQSGVGVIGNRYDPNNKKRRKEIKSILYPGNTYVGDFLYSS